MYRKFRITVVSLVIMTIVVLSSTGTLSYFTDTDGATNEFVVGNASTALTVYGDANGTTELKDMLGEILSESDGKVVDNTEVPLYLSATNDGNISVYQRFRVVIPKALSNIVTLHMPEMNDNCKVETASGHRCSNENYTVTYNDSVDDTEYAEYYIISNAKLALNSTTYKWPTLGMQFGNISSVENFDTLLTCEDDDVNRCTLGIKFYTDAIQTAGFENAVDAFENFRETYN